MSSSYQARIAERDAAQTLAQRYYSEVAALRRELRQQNGAGATGGINEVNETLKRKIEVLEEALKDRNKTQRLLDESAEFQDYGSSPATPTARRWTPPEGYVKAVRHIYHNDAEILGTGAESTIVVKGFFVDGEHDHGRACAVKKMVTHSCSEEAMREIQTLLLLAPHPNIVKYYFKEEAEGFIYLALELCDGTLHNVVPPFLLNPISKTDKISILSQVLEALKFLHGQNISHRDIKPANILVNRSVQTANVKLADMGFAKQLDSSLGSASVVSRSKGWQPAEVLEFFDAKAQNLDPEPVEPMAIDLFSVGLVIFWLFTDGKFHPFGGGMKTEPNIAENKAVNLGQQRVPPEVEDLVKGLIDTDPEARTRIPDCLKHPVFWTTSYSLKFLMEVSDMLVNARKSRNAMLTTWEASLSSFLAPSTDWRGRVDPSLLVVPRTCRPYTRTAADLLRMVRDKAHHFEDIPLAVRSASMGNTKEGLLDYLLTKFPSLVVVTFRVMAKFYCTPDATFSLSPTDSRAYLKQSAKLSKANINIPLLAPFFEEFSIRYLTSL